MGRGDRAERGDRRRELIPAGAQRAPRSVFDREGRASLGLRLRGLAPDSPRAWGRMSAHQMVCHVSGAFRVPLGELDCRRVDTLLSRTAMRWVAFHTPVRWPKGAPTSPELDVLKGGGTPQREFERDVAGLEDLLERFAALEARIGGTVHPLFGPLSRAEWDRWAWRHTDHHLRQFGV